MYGFLKKKWLWLLFAVVFALGGVSLWYLGQDSDEAQVRRTLRQLCRISSKYENEKAAVGVMKINGTDKVFAPECRIDFRHEMFGGIYTPAEITSTMARVRSMFRSCVVDMRDVAITVEPPDRASAVFTGTLDGRLNDGKTVNEVRDLYCTLEKREDRWLITSISVRDVLEK
ncbi:hypothetical protein FYJ85_09485 [Victivallaceae bacterium BBE-744-WT-12]|uniref:SnoaL-like domain-containing protein n=1 Tax=Victivallis lenta TaxID=2606640 RepID=A0A844G2X7_9BACT|nr:hypothetical protein [Victivallis lenta]MST97272.1 hypothetical protein [Victivallis lenta]